MTEVVADRGLVYEGCFCRTISITLRESSSPKESSLGVNCDLAIFQARLSSGQVETKPATSTLPTFFSYDFQCRQALVLSKQP